jgi:hypothetical protein
METYWSENRLFKNRQLIIWALQSLPFLLFLSYNFCLNFNFYLVTCLPNLFINGEMVDGRDCSNISAIHKMQSKVKFNLLENYFKVIFQS